MLEIMKKKEKEDYSYLNLPDNIIEWVKQSHFNPLTYNLTELEKDNLGLREYILMRDPDYVGFTTHVLLGIDLLPIQMVLQEILWKYSFPMVIASRGFSKSFSMAVAGLLKGALIPNTKIVVVGAAFRQSKIIFDYMCDIWRRSVLPTIFKGKMNGPKQSVDTCLIRMDSSVIYILPLGTGDRIRGMRANVVYADEFGSIPTEIFETVIAGFGVVSQNPIENVKMAAKKQALQAAGKWTEEHEDEFYIPSNQLVLSGTVSSTFNHFYDYWKRYKQIIKSRGDREKLEEIVGEDKFTEGLNWKDYCIVRIPYELVPKAFMSEEIVARARATMNTSIFRGEYGACFYDDTEGFFKESLIRHATVSNRQNIEHASCGKVMFNARIRGDSNLKYVFGIDPAASRDNFAIVILELHVDHTRIVYCWTTNRDDYNKRRSNQKTPENDYYSFCCRKIRDLMAAFPCVGIALDSQGGGETIKQMLGNPDFLQPGEQRIFEVKDEDKPKDTDDLAGLHILSMIQFVNAKWTSDANHSLKADFENRMTLFPPFNPIILGFAAEDDKVQDSMYQKDFVSYDNLEDCILEIEELKKELTVIEWQWTGARERWELPDTGSNSKHVLRKDRYSALLMANWLARNTARVAPPPRHRLVGGVVGKVGRAGKGKAYDSPEWWSKVDTGLFVGINKGGRGRR